MKSLRIQHLALAAALALGAAAVQAQPPMPRPDGAPMMGHEGMHRGMFGHGPMRHLLHKAGASEAQRSQIEAIFKAAHDDLAGQRDAGRKLHEQMRALFAAPTIDAAAIEALRQRMSARHEAESKRMSQALIDAARVLTPEQRAKIAEAMQKRGARMSDHHRKPE